MPRKLAVVVLGERNSGKSSVWYAVFGRSVRTGHYERELDLGRGRGECSVFLINGSPVETDTSLTDRLDVDRPQIILCSEQYNIGAQSTFNFLYENDYEIFIVWLNPGANDSRSYADYLGFSPKLIASGVTLLCMPGGLGPDTQQSTNIANRIREKIYGWKNYWGV